MSWFFPDLLEQIFSLLRGTVISAVLCAGAYGLIFRLKVNPK